MGTQTHTPTHSSLSKLRFRNRSSPRGEENCEGGKTPSLYLSKPVIRVAGRDGVEADEPRDEEGARRDAGQEEEEGPR